MMRIVAPLRGDPAAVPDDPLTFSGGEAVHAGTNKSTASVKEIDFNGAQDRQNLATEQKRIEREQGVIIALSRTA